MVSEARYYKYQNLCGIWTFLDPPHPMTPPKILKNKVSAIQTFFLSNIAIKLIPGFYFYSVLDFIVCSDGIYAYIKIYLAN